MKRTVAHLVVALCVVCSVRADQTTQSVQQALADQGFYYGNVTGEKSVETTAAIRRYQIRNGLQVTGEINPETLRSLNVSSNSVSRVRSPLPLPSLSQPLPALIIARGLDRFCRRVHLASRIGGSRRTRVSLVRRMNGRRLG